MKLFSPDKKIIRASWIYGAFFGFMPPYIFALITMATVEDYRMVYHFRLMLAIIMGALIGGFAASLAVKLTLKFLKKSKWYVCLILGLLLGAVVGAITLGSTPLTLLISSTDVKWAIETIIRSSLVGVTMGSIAGAFFGVMLNRYLKS